MEQCNFIKNYYQENDNEKLYLTVHNIDGTMLRSNTVSIILSVVDWVANVLISYAEGVYIFIHCICSDTNNTKFAGTISVNIPYRIN